MSTLIAGGTIDRALEDITSLSWSWENEFSEGVVLVDAGTFTVVDESDPTNVTALPVISGENLEVDGISVTFVVACDAAMLGHIYRVTHHVTTTESTPQERSRSFFVQTRVL